MLRIVLDTNVLVSAVIARGKPRQLLQSAIERRVQIVLSEPLLDEFRRTIGRPKLKLSRPEVAEAVRLVRETAETVGLRSSYRVVIEDPDDDLVLGTAVDGSADYVVSGDQHLLSLNEFKGIGIVTAAEMIGILRRQR